MTKELQSAKNGSDGHPDNHGSGSETKAGPVRGYVGSDWSKTESGKLAYSPDGWSNKKWGKSDWSDDTLQEKNRNGVNWNKNRYWKDGWSTEGYDYSRDSWSNDPWKSYDKNNSWNDKNNDWNDKRWGRNDFSYGQRGGYSINDWKSGKPISQIEPVDFSSTKLVDFVKDFYVPTVSVESRTEKDCEQIRE